MRMYLAYLLLLAALVATSSGFTGIHSRETREPFYPVIQSRHAVETKWITQRVNHFDPVDDRTWQMRYMSNDEHFKPGGPVIIYIGGEWVISAGSLLGGQAYDIAKQHNGYLFYTEHRYYGQSRPTKDASTANLKYLSVDQALADLAYFVQHVKETIKGLENSRVVIIGGSYAGSMAAWFRHKYPHLADGALASSAPLLAIADFYQYHEVVGKALVMKAGQQCYDLVQEAMFELRRELKRTGGQESIKGLFNLCDSIDLTSWLDLGSFFESLSGLFAGTVQYHDNGDIEGVCAFLEREALNRTELWALSRLARSRWGSGGCARVDYATSVKAFSGVEWDTPSTAGSTRQWLYQTCTEYGYYQTDRSVRQPFGTGMFTLDMYIQLCKDLYKDAFTNNAKHILETAVNRTNVFYGALAPDVTNVIYTHGTVDPWHAIGLLEDANEFSPAIVVPGTSHCKDLNSLSDRDTEEMKAAKKRVLQIVASWLK